MENITIIIHSYFSTQINDCIKSAFLLTKHILIVGSEKRKDVKVINSPNSGIVETNREFGIMQADTDWVFLLDSDERITPQLAQEIKLILTKSADITYYKIPRKEIIFGKKWLKYGGWWPNYQTRLIKKNAFMSWPKHIHSTPNIKGKCGLLTNGLIHYSQNDLSEVVTRTINFENKESELLFQARKKVNTITFFRKFFGELWRRLIGKLGFLDGQVGIIESIYQAYSKTITYIYLYEKSRPIRPLS